MLDFFHRKRLVRQGLACGKQRRTLDEESHGRLLEENRGVRLGIVALGGAGLGFLAWWGAPAGAGTASTALLVELVYAMALIVVPRQVPALASNSRLLLFVLLLALNLLLFKLMVLGLGGPPEDAVPPVTICLAPAAFAPMLASILLGGGAGALMAMANGLGAALLAPGMFASHAVHGILVGVLAVVFTENLRKRGQLIRAGCVVGGASMIFAAGLALASGGVPFETLLHRTALAGATGVGTGIAVNAVLPVFESVFRVTTGVSWLEMADLNHPLLQRLSLEAPGTFHHSLVVANLAESAALAIGANGLQCRVGAYFHDVGKLVKPEYYCENQSHGGNPHDALNPTMSALIVVAHVKEGVNLALEHRLVAEVLDAIREHHGTCLVGYFHARAVRDRDDAVEGTKIMNLPPGDVPQVSEEVFRYSGPKPQSRETAILMIADACESASRSLEKPTPQRIEELAASVIRQRIDDGQFDECPISFRELKTVEARIAFTLQSALHARVSYPRLPKAGAPDETDPDQPDQPAKGDSAQPGRAPRAA